MNIKGLSTKLGVKENRDSLFNNDIIMLSETWLGKHSNDKKSKKKYSIPDFKPINRPRMFRHPRAKRDSGGILLYIRKNLLGKIKVVENMCDHYSIVKITNMFPFTAYIIFCYIPPKDSDYVCRTCDNHYLEHLTDLVVKYSAKGCVAVCGDLNARTGLLDDRPCHSTSPFS